jgi:hypothetical protein
MYAYVAVVSRNRPRGLLQDLSTAKMGFELCRTGSAEMMTQHTPGLPGLTNDQCSSTTNTYAFIGYGQGIHACKAVCTRMTLRMQLCAVL